MSKKSKLAVLAAVLAVSGAISSPVLAGGWDDDWFVPPNPCFACRDYPPEPTLAAGYDDWFTPPNPCLAMNGAISSPVPQHQLAA